MAFGLVDQARQRRFVGDVDALAKSAEGFTGLGGGFGVQVGDDDFGALGVKRTGAGFADAAGAAGDNGDFTVEIHCSVLPDDFPGSLNG